jgi:ribosomal protein S18 acetylase RimI-like enzyme
MTIRPFKSSDEESVIDLWRRCNLVRPQNNPHKDIQRKLKVQPHLFLLAEIEGAIVGSAMAGYEGHRGWINYLAVCPNRRRRGIARALMLEAERLLKLEGCPKINLQVRSTNTEILAFYKAIGFASDDVVSLGKRLESDEDRSASNRSTIQP